MKADPNAVRLWRGQTGAENSPAASEVECKASEFVGNETRFDNLQNDIEFARQKPLVGNCRLENFYCSYDLRIVINR